MSRVFFDSNVLLYGYASNDSRSSRAQELVEPGGAISIQCLNEFASVAIGKLRMSWPQVNDSLAVILGLCSPVVTVGIDTHHYGLSIAERHRLSVYDAMIIAAALEATCDTLYSEDMHHGLVVDGRLTIINPFV